MNIKAIITNAWPILAFLALVTIMFFPEYQGKTVERVDSIQGQAKMKAIIDYREKTGQNYLWNPSQFSGMPMLYGVPSSKNVLVYVDKAIKLFQKRPMSFFFIGLLFAFLLGRLGFSFDNMMSFFLAISTILPITNLSLWKAGHISKIEVLTYTPLLVLSVILLFEKKRYLLGSLFLSFGTAMSLQLRHPQMTYYIMMMFLVYAVIKLIQLAKKQVEFKHLGIGILFAIGAIGLGVGSSASKIWSMKVHSDASLRGAPILKSANSQNADNETTTTGLEWDYAMQWSNGLKDLGALFIPGLVGGANGEKVGKSSEFFKKYKVSNAPLYWGNLPFTEAPMYLGAISIFLFIFGSFYVRSHIKWWIVISVLLTILISLGNSLEGFNKFIFDYFPLYNKFRAPQSILAVTPFFLTILGVLGLTQLIKEGKSNKFDKALIISSVITCGFALIAYLVFPSSLSFEGLSDSRYQQQGIDLSVFRTDRINLLKKDSLRSLFFVALTSILLWSYSREKINKIILSLGLIALMVIDHTGVNNRYLTYKNYKPKRKVDNAHQLRDVDQQILNVEKERHNYRVLDLSINTYQAANTSYFHNTIGGYDPVKLQRYEDIKNTYLLKNHPGVLNMLNTKYFITPGDGGKLNLQKNPSAMGVAWFVNNVTQISSPEEEFNLLNTSNLSSTALINTKEFTAPLASADLNNLSGDGLIQITEYTPDNITYKTNNVGDGIAVFSEIWFNGKSWKAYIDGQATPIIRSNYLLRSLFIPKGSHTINFVFQPSAFYTGETISLISSVILLLAGLLFMGRKMLKMKDKPAVAASKVKKKANARKASK